MLGSSILTCQIGQCGNQLGQAMYKSLIEESLGADLNHQLATLSTYFHNDPKGGSQVRPSSLMIDMEPKVIDGILSQKEQWWAYDPKLTVCREEGSGNNWAFGFHLHGENCLSEILDKFNSLAERVDCVEGVVVLQSLAGGTGSGVGSRVLEELRNVLGSKPIFSVAVLPRLSGEVILQFYNAVFSLANLYNVRSC